MTPLPSKEQLSRRQVYNPIPGTVSATELVEMAHRRKKRLSDWAVGALMLGIQNGEITRKQADIFQSVFVRGAKIRKTREHVGHPFLGPDKEIMTIDGKDYPGDSKVGKNTSRLALEDVRSHPGYDAWFRELFTSAKEGEGWASEREDSPDNDVKNQNFESSKPSNIKIALPRRSKKRTASSLVDGAGESQLESKVGEEADGKMGDVEDGKVDGKDDKGEEGNEGGDEKTDEEGEKGDEIKGKMKAKEVEAQAVEGVKTEKDRPSLTVEEGKAQEKNPRPQAKINAEPKNKKPRVRRAKAPAKTKAERRAKKTMSSCENNNKDEARESDEVAEQLSCTMSGALVE